MCERIGKCAQFPWFSVAGCGGERHYLVFWYYCSYDLMHLFTVVSKRSAVWQERMIGMLSIKNEGCQETVYFITSRIITFWWLLGRCIIYIQIVLRKMNVIFCVSLFSSLAYARAQRGFCTFCFHNLHRIGSKYLATSNLSVFFSRR